MGGSQSTEKNFPLRKFVLQGDNNDFNKMKNILIEISKENNLLIENYKKLQKLNNQEFPITSKSFIDSVKKNKDSNIDNESLEKIFNMFGFYGEPIDEKKHKLIINENFLLIVDSYNKRISKLNEKSKPIEIKEDSVIAENNQLEYKLKELNESINAYYARFIYYCYSISYNDFLAGVYTLFAIRQFKNFDEHLRNTKLELELKEIVNDLTNEKIIGTLKKENDEFLKTLKKTNANVSKTLDDKKNSAVSSITAQSGGNMSVLQDIIKKHDEKKKEYDLSNKLFDAYLKNINEEVKNKLNLLISKYNDLFKNRYIINENLAKSLGDFKTILTDITQTTHENVQKLKLAVSQQDLKIDEFEKIVQNMLQNSSNSSNSKESYNKMLKELYEKRQFLNDFITKISNYHTIQANAKTLNNVVQQHEQQQ
jgi:hypothetical protein